MTTMTLFTVHFKHCNLPLLEYSRSSVLRSDHCGVTSLFTTRKCGDLLPLDAQYVYFSPLCGRPPICGVHPCRLIGHKREVLL